MKKNRKIVIFMLLLCIILTIIFGIILYKNYEQKQRNKCDITIKNDDFIRFTDVKSIDKNLGISNITIFRSKKEYEINGVIFNTSDSEYKTTDFKLIFKLSNGQTKHINVQEKNIADHNFKKFTIITKEDLKCTKEFSVKNR